MTEALKISNIKTILFILRTIDKEGSKLYIELTRYIVRTVIWLKD